MKVLYIYYFAYLFTLGLEQVVTNNLNLRILPTQFKTKDTKTK
jgi:hypothetical protein